MSESNKTITAIFYENYGKTIIQTLENVLKELGAENILISGTYMKFSVKQKNNTINLTEFFNNIFMIDGQLDLSLSNPEKTFNKSIDVIGKTLLSL